MPEISVIIPVYKVEAYLPQCLDSVLSQDIRDIEVICINDCSPDACGEILSDYQKKDSRVKVFTNTVNLKASKSRNFGIDIATGDYLYFIDADDFIDPQFLSLMYQKAVETGADITTNTHVTLKKGNMVCTYNHRSSPQIPEQGCFIDRKTAIDDLFCPMWLRLYKHSFIKKNNIRYHAIRMTEDKVFHMITSIHADSIFAFYGKPSYNYILRDDSTVALTTTESRQDLQLMSAYNYVFDYLTEKNLIGQYPAKLFQADKTFSVDTEEKFLYFRDFFLKTGNLINEHRERYQNMELFFPDSILAADSYEEYRKNNPANVAMAYLNKQLIEGKRKLQNSLH